MSFVKVHEAFIEILGKRCGQQWDFLLPSSVLNPSSIVDAEIDCSFGLSVNTQPRIDEASIVHLENVGTCIYQNPNSHFLNPSEQPFFCQTFSIQSRKLVSTVPFL